MATNANKNEIIAHQWDTLRSLWESCRSSVDPTEQGKIDELFPDKSTVWSSDADAWRQLNYAEQRVGTYLDATVLAVEYLALLDIARNRNATSVATYEEKKGLFVDPPPTGTTVSQQRAVYQLLLQSLQGEFIETRFRRRLRRETASRLFCFGIVVLLIALAPLAIYFGLVWIGFDDVMNLYQWRMLALRLLYGMIGAIIFYYIVRAGLLGGGAFPELTKLSDGNHLVTETILAPSPDIAKLLIWSFLAGFSERLVPDALDRTEAQGNKKPKVS